MTVVYEDDDFSVTSDGTAPQVVSASVMDTWPDDASVYSGADTTQEVCTDASEADIESNNMCFRSDVQVSKSDAKKMFVIESGGCPDHGNMKGGGGTIAIANSQVTPGSGDVSDCNSGGTCG